MQLERWCQHKATGNKSKSLSLTNYELINFLRMEIWNSVRLSHLRVQVVWCATTSKVQYGWLSLHVTSRTLVFHMHKQKHWQYIRGTFGIASQGNAEYMCFVLTLWVSYPPLWTQSEHVYSLPKRSIAGKNATGMYSLRIELVAVWWISPLDETRNNSAWTNTEGMSVNTHEDCGGEADVGP